MAASRPSGRQITAAMSVTTIVPESSGSTPNLAFLKSGAHSVPVKKSTGLTARKKSTLGTTSASTIPTVTTIENAAHANRLPTMIFSR